MEGSGSKVYVTAAYGRLNGIFNSKSWVKALRSYNNVASHLERFPSRGPTSFEPIDGIPGYCLSTHHRSSLGTQLPPARSSHPPV